MMDCFETSFFTKDANFLDHLYGCYLLKKDLAALSSLYISLFFVSSLKSYNEVYIYALLSVVLKLVSHTKMKT